MKCRRKADLIDAGQEISRNQGTEFFIHGKAHIRLCPGTDCFASHFSWHTTSNVQGTASRHLEALMDKGILTKIGATGKGTYYVLSRKRACKGLKRDMSKV